MELKFLENEFWYGSCVKYGMKMPFSIETNEIIDFTINKTPNQGMPLLLSTKGRIIWRNEGFPIEFKNGTILIPNDCIVSRSGNTLKEAYLFAAKNYFPFNPTTPAKELFEKIIYNTWIEFTFYQNQKDILDYARKVIDSGMGDGVLMIDDGWSEYYGDWRFHSGKFPNPQKMINELKTLGFKVMVWVCPFVTPDTIKFREAEKKGILVKNKNGDTLIVKWWNGYSAVLDFTNPEAETWLKSQLTELEKIGVDGFKFDAGDSFFYNDDDITFKEVIPNEQSRLWAKFGEQYPFNEYRVTFNAGGYALLQRLCDKTHTWGNDGIASLIPDTLLQGITGHPYGCPDMIGGGEYSNFIDLDSSKLDQELFVRHGEIACLLPAMQFSAAPFRVLNKKNFESILKSIATRKNYISYIMEHINNIPKTYEPLIRYMSYEFPQEPVEKITNQFMLGEKYLVAPVFEKNQTGRTVYIPKGTWKFNDSFIFSNGEERFFDSTPGIPLIFEKINS